MDDSIKDKVRKILLDDTSGDEVFSKQLNEVREYIASHKKAYTFQGVKDLEIYCESCIVDNPCATVVICTGFTDNAYAYEELIYYFNKFGYSVFIIENRGNSRSGRLGCDEYQVSIDSYEDYVKDFNTFIETIVKPNSNNTDLYGFGHSMGGLITTLYAQTYPDVFKKIVLSSPMHDINTGNIPKVVAKGLSKIVSKINGKKYVIGHAPMSEAGCVFPYTEVDSVPRFKELSDGPKKLHEKTRCGGASYKWTAESYKAIKKAQSKKNKEKIKAPIIICQATHDMAVDIKGQNKFAKDMINCEIKIFNNAGHEIFKAPNDVFEKFLCVVLDFYNN